MGKSQASKSTDRLARKLFKELKPLGFLKRSRTFNREFSPGWYHVIELDLFYCKGFPASHQFFLSVGIAQDTFTEVIKKGFRTQRFSDFASLWDCFIAYTLHKENGLVRYSMDHGFTENPDFGIFWDPLSDEDELVPALSRILNETGLPFLDSLNETKNVVDYYLNHNRDSWNPISLARRKSVLLNEIGDRSGAEKFVKEVGSLQSNLSKEVAKMGAKVFFKDSPEELLKKLPKRNEDDGKE